MALALDLWDKWGRAVCMGAYACGKRHVGARERGDAPARAKGSATGRNSHAAAALPGRRSACQ